MTLELFRNHVRSAWQPFNRDNRGVSIAVDHALGLLILLALTGLFVGAVTDIHDDRESLIVEQELDRVGDEVAAGITTADTLGSQAEDRPAAGADASAESRITLPSSIGGESYSVTIDGADAGDEVVITARSQGEEVETTVAVDSEVEDGSAGSPGAVFGYETDGDGDSTITINERGGNDD